MSILLETLNILVANISRFTVLHDSLKEQSIMGYVQ